MSYHPLQPVVWERNLRLRRPHRIEQVDAELLRPVLKWTPQRDDKVVVKYREHYLDGTVINTGHRRTIDVRYRRPGQKHPSLKQFKEFEVWPVLSGELAPLMERRAAPQPVLSGELAPPTERRAAPQLAPVLDPTDWNKGFNKDDHVMFSKPTPNGQLPCEDNGAHGKIVGFDEKNKKFLVLVSDETEHWKAQYCVRYQPKAAAQIRTHRARQALPRSDRQDEEKDPRETPPPGRAGDRVMIKVAFLKKKVYIDPYLKTVSLETLIGKVGTVELRQHSVRNMVYVNFESNTVVALPSHCLTPVTEHRIRDGFVVRIGSSVRVETRYSNKRAILLGQNESGRMFFVKREGETEPRSVFPDNLFPDV